MVDAVVIGSGPNGLVFANLLADAGWSMTGGRLIFTPKSFEAHNSNLDHEPSPVELPSYTSS